MPSPLHTSVAPSLYTPLEPIDRKELPHVLAPRSLTPDCCLELSNFFVRFGFSLFRPSLSADAHAYRSVLWLQSWYVTA